VSIEPEIKHEGFGGGHLLVGAWGPGPLGPLKSGPGQHPLMDEMQSPEKCPLGWLIMHL